MFRAIWFFRPYTLPSSYTHSSLLHPPLPLIRHTHHTHLVQPQLTQTPLKPSSHPPHPSTNPLHPPLISQPFNSSLVPYSTHPLHLPNPTTHPQTLLSSLTPFSHPAQPPLVPHTLLSSLLRPLTRPTLNHPSQYPLIPHTLLQTLTPSHCPSQPAPIPRPFTYPSHLRLILQLISHP
jgi:hypothetical protein